MGMEKVESAAPENEASRAVCERLGMTQEGITRRAERLADRVVDHVHYGPAAGRVAEAEDLWMTLLSASNPPEGKMTTLPHIATPRTRLTVLTPERGLPDGGFPICAPRPPLPWEPRREESFSHPRPLADPLCATVTATISRAVPLQLVALDPRGERVLATCNFTNIVMGMFRRATWAMPSTRSTRGRPDAGGGRRHRSPVPGAGPHRIMASHMPANLRSGAPSNGWGSSRGYARDYLMINGRWEDHVPHRAHQSRWPAEPLSKGGWQGDRHRFSLQDRTICTPHTPGDKKRVKLRPNFPGRQTQAATHGYARQTL